jgi:hypothetical protein
MKTDTHQLTAEKFMKSVEEGSEQEIRPGYTLKRSCDRPWIDKLYYIFSIGRDGICEYHPIEHTAELAIWLRMNGYGRQRT